jgi:hypothetical protein
MGFTMDKKYTSEMKKIYKAEGFEALIQSLSAYVAQNDLPQHEAEELARKFFEITAGGGDYFEASAGVLFKDLHTKFPNSEKIKNHFDDVCDELKNNGIFFPQEDIFQKQSSQTAQIFKRTQTYKTEFVFNEIDEILLASFDLMSEIEDEWKQIEIENCCLEAGLSAVIKFCNEENERVNIDAADNFSYYSDLIVHLNQIKKAMYRQVPKEGAWIMSSLIIQNDKSYTITFNYDDFDKFSNIAKDPADLVREFEFYPRSKDFTPGWWQRLLKKRAKYIE